MEEEKSFWIDYEYDGHAFKSNKPIFTHFKFHFVLPNKANIVFELESDQIDWKALYSDPQFNYIDRIYREGDEFHFYFPGIKVKMHPSDKDNVVSYYPNFSMTMPVDVVLPELKKIVDFYDDHTVENRRCKTCESDEDDS